jgi:NTE family protein
VRRALVLGAGGHAANAWELGVITGLAAAGVDVRNADLFVGTSAGSRVAVQITSVRPLEELFQRQADPGLQTQESAPAVDFGQWRAAFVRAKEGPTGINDILKRLGSLSPMLPAVPESERRNEIASGLPVHTWPEQNVQVVAVDAESGERRTFDRTSGVDLIDALAASSAIPGLRPLVTIEGHRYMDGGVYSIDNADLATGYDRVLILTLRARVPPTSVVSLEAALEALRGKSAQVEVIFPDEATEAAIASVGGNLLDPSVREGAARAGREQGRRAANLLGSLWR